MHSRLCSDSTPTRRPLARALALLTGTTVVALGCLLPVSAAGAATAPGAAAPSSVTAASSPDASASTPKAPAGALDSYRDGQYIVTLRDPAVATYTGGIGGLAATRAPEGDSLDTGSRRVATYTEHLTSAQDEIAASVDAAIVSSYTLATNGFSSSLTAAQAKKLADDPRVASVVPNEIVHLDDPEPETSTGFLGLQGDQGVWASIGGPGNAGKGVVVGIIDTGIAPENPSFAGDPLGTEPGEAPYRDGDQIVFDKSDGSQFHGVCVTGVQFTADDCSTKIVGARYFVDNYGEGNIGDPSIGEYLSPRDGADHGSHTASTAAGDNAVDAQVDGQEFGEISGVAPAAKIAAYKVCWSGKNAVSEDDDGCATGDLLAAIDAAVADGVDVINFSIGGGAAQTTVSLTDQAFFSAAAAGIFVAAAAGNAGPTASTADNAAPWITTVAAGSIPTHDATVRLGDGEAFVGASISLPDSDFSGPLVSATAVAATGAADPQLCGPDTLDPAKAAGAIVLCERGVIDRTLKSAEVARAGGIGMVLVNPTPSSLDLDGHSIPTVHLDADAMPALTAYAATAGATVTLQRGNTTDKPSAPSPQVAGFSSRGPILADGSDILKPDITAPGVAILAAGANPEGAAGSWLFMSGTSMASPHIAGLAALYLGQHPTAAPAEIKSAMMTTAYDTVDSTGAPAEDPFAQGAGHVDPTHYFDPGLLYLNGVEDWMSYTDSLGYSGFGSPVIDPSDLNLPSIAIGALPGTQTVTRTVTATAPGHYTARPVSMAGVDVAVSPSDLTFTAAGESQSYTVTFTRTDAPLDEFTTGYLDWTDGERSVRSALAVRPISLDAPAEAEGSGSAGSTPIDVLGGDVAEYPVTSSGLAEGRAEHGSGTAGGATQGFIVDVPEGSTFARFDLDASDDTADLDLTVYSIDGLEHTWLVGQSATGSADERVDLDADMLQPGRYLLGVDFFAGVGDIDFTLTSYVIDPATSVGSLTVTPATVSTTIGRTSTVTANWTGLAPGGSYLGRVVYGDTGHATTLTVTSDPGTPEPPVPGDPSLTVAPSSVRPGEGTTVRASGLTPGDEYEVFQDGSGSVGFAGVVDADGGFWRYVGIAASTPLGAHRFEVRTAHGSASAAFDVVDILTQAIDPFISHRFDGSPVVDLNITFVGKGDLRTRLESSDGTVYLDETGRSEAPVDAPNFTFREGPFDVKPGDYIATLWVVTPDGALTQQKRSEFTVEQVPASTATFTPDAADPNAVDFTLLNSTDEPMTPRVQYKLCSGPQAFAEEFYTPGATTETWNLSGIARVDVWLDGRVIAGYENPSATACEGTATISQDFWATVAAGSAAPAADGADAAAAAAPLTLTVSNRVDIHSGGFDLSMGTGSTLFETDPVFFEKIPTPYLETPGLVIDRSIPASEGTPYWAVAQYGQHFDWAELQKQRVVIVPALTVADLAPVVPGGPDAPGEPGGPGNPGGPGDPGDPSGTAPVAPVPADGADAATSLGTASGAGSLSSTGMSTGLPISIALLLVAAGAGFVLLRRTRRRAG
ncbi:S8 family serine peptidase [Herbiconiux solani]|uniref:S8 family serine peptidase n=1 Tax=Herbiconiux solani TaxID=661329 RepID=UPI0008246DA3|nr:S8 family serine peptidase [Herbiconiux solani]